MKAVDFLGREIKPGDYVVHPLRRYSSLWVNLYRVQEVTPYTHIPYYGKEELRPALRVVPVKTGKFKDLGKPRMLKSLDRTVRVELTEEEISALGVIDG